MDDCDAKNIDTFFLITFSDGIDINHLLAQFLILIDFNEDFWFLSALKEVSNAETHSMLEFIERSMMAVPTMVYVQNSKLYKSIEVLGVTFDRFMSVSKHANTMLNTPFFYYHHRKINSVRQVLNCKFFESFS